MVIDIIPTKKLPKSLSVLSYQVPKNIEKQIKIGQLINIPIRNTLTTGIVLNIYKSKHFPYKLKYINNLINSKPIFTQNQLILFTKLSDYYHVSASLFVHFNLPQMIKKDWQQLPSSHKPIKFNRKQPKYLWWQTINERNKIYLQYIKSNKKTSTQILFLVPRIDDIDTLAYQLKLKPSSYIKIHRQLKRSDNFNIWKKLLKGNPTIIIGTRSAILYPFTKLKTIIIDDETSIDHKQYDMNPRYNVKTVASKMNISQLLLSSPAPSIENYYLLKPAQNKPKITKNIKIIDLKNELIKKNYSFISEELENQITSTLKNKKSIFLLINKKGDSSTTICKDCHHSFNCPICNIPLIKHATNLLRCYHCNYSEELPPFCPQCSQPNFKSSGLGTQKIENTISKIFPHNKIIRIDKDQSINQKIAKKSIIIGTLFALNKIDWSTIGLIGIINSDQLHQHAEFSTAENAYILLTKILTYSEKNANIIIQSFNPNHYILEAIIANKPKIFYNKEIEYRKQFDYPPFTNLIKLSILDISLSRAKYKIDKLYSKLTKINTEITLNPPIPILRKKIRNKFKFNIIIKIKNLDTFTKIIKLIPHDCSIDIHPNNLLD